MELRATVCPGCGAAEFAKQGEAQVRCPYCGQVFALSPGFCLDCGQHSEPDVGACAGCGAAVVWVCPVCGNDNPPGARNCGRCRRRVDEAERIVRERLMSAREWREARRESYGRLKKAEERASRERMRAFVEAEQTRLAAVQQALEERRQHERRMLWMVMGLLLLVVVAIAVAAVVVGPQ